MPIFAHRSTIVLLILTAAGWFVITDSCLSQDAPTPFSGPRELLSSLGVDDRQLQLFHDGKSLAEEEREPLLRTLYAIRKFGLIDIERWARADFPAKGNLIAPAKIRGEAFLLQGTVVKATLETLPAERAARFELAQYYRCKIVLGEAKTPAIVYALRIPNAWKLDAPLDERVSCRGIFLKLGEESEGRATPLFAAGRMAWHKRDVLGALGFDFGLFDDVTNKTAITSQEKECFYQLLAACNRAGTQELLRRTSRPEGQDYSVVPLFNDADGQHGELTALTGVARRAILVRLDRDKDRETIERFGFDHYYQVEVFTGDSQGNPLVFCLLKLPPGMTAGADIAESVCIPGVFFKSWAYHTYSRDGRLNKALQLAPLLIGREPQRIVTPPASHSPAAGIVAGCLFTAAIAGVFLWVWRWNRADLRFHRATIAKRFEPPATGSLNDLKLE